MLLETQFGLSEDLTSERFQFGGMGIDGLANSSLQFGGGHAHYSTDNGRFSIRAHPASADHLARGLRCGWVPACQRCRAARERCIALRPSR